MFTLFALSFRILTSWSTRGNHVAFVCSVSFVCVVQQSVYTDYNMGFIGNMCFFFVLFVSLFDLLPDYVTFLSYVSLLSILSPTIQYEKNISFACFNNTIFDIYRFDLILLGFKWIFVCPNMWHVACLFYFRINY